MKNLLLLLKSIKFEIENPYWYNNILPRSYGFEKFYLDTEEFRKQHGEKPILGIRLFSELLLCPDFYCIKKAYNVYTNVKSLETQELPLDTTYMLLICQLFEEAQVENIFLKLKQPSVESLTECLTIGLPKNWEPEIHKEVLYKFTEHFREKQNSQNPLKFSDVIDFIKACFEKINHSLVMDNLIVQTHSMSYYWLEEKKSKEILKQVPETAKIEYMKRIQKQGKNAHEASLLLFEELLA